MAVRGVWPLLPLLPLRINPGRVFPKNRILLAVDGHFLKKGRRSLSNNEKGTDPFSVSLSLSTARQIQRPMNDSTRAGCVQSTSEVGRVRIAMTLKLQ
jgi:hypothetical protein